MCCYCLVSEFSDKIFIKKKYIYCIFRGLKISRYGQATWASESIDGGHIKTFGGTVCSRMFYAYFTFVKKLGESAGVSPMAEPRKGVLGVTTPIEPQITSYILLFLIFISKCYILSH